MCAFLFVYDCGWICYFFVNMPSDAYITERLFIPMLLESMCCLMFTDVVIMCGCVACMLVCPDVCVNVSLDLLSATHS